MTAPKYRVRRATVDDRPALKALWDSMHFPTPDLERRLTEFQVVTSEDGSLVGAIGLQIDRQHAWLHSEAYIDFALADEVRPLLVERLNTIASNHGVFRLWTLERAPFWTRHGFQPATPETLKRLPEKWAALGTGWRTVQLKDEEAIVSLEKELALMMQTEKRRTERIMKRVGTLKSLALWVALVLAIFVLGAAVYLLVKNPGLLTPRS